MAVITRPVWKASKLVKGKSSGKASCEFSEEPFNHLGRVVALLVVSEVVSLCRRQPGRLG
jgi:hypothetical protein